MAQVQLTKEECVILQSAMKEAVNQCRADLLREGITHDETQTTLYVRSIFLGLYDKFTEAIES